MGNGIYVATSGAIAQSSALDVTANNVANAGTAGFRAERLAFGEVLGKTKSPDTSFVRVSKSGVSKLPGDLTQTGNPLDVAIQGDGNFGINTSKGIRYTRDGSFRTNSDGLLATSAGDPVRARGGGTIAIPPDAESVEINGSGSVLADGEEIGTLEISRFANGALKAEGGNMYVARGKPLAGGEPPQVIAGALENSNVSVLRGVVDMVRISRNYESLMRMIEAYRAIDDRTVRDLGNGR